MFKVISIIIGVQVCFNLIILLRDPRRIFANSFLHTNNDKDNVISHVTPRNEIEYTPRNEVEVGPTWWDVLDFWTVYTETEMTMTTNLFTPKNEVEVWYF